MKLILMEKIWLALGVTAFIVHIVLFCVYGGWSAEMNYWFLGEVVMNYSFMFICTTIHCNRLKKEFKSLITKTK